MLKIAYKTGYKVCDAMTRNPVSISPGSTIYQCAIKMKEKHIGGLVVTEGKSLLGFISDRDIVRKVIAEKKDPSSANASEIMAKNLVTISPEADIYDALIKMRDTDVRHLPVMSSGNMVGIITLKDILKIQPQLFELVVEKYELREESRKPVLMGPVSEGLCEGCGFPSRNLREIEGCFLCTRCARKV